MKRGEIWTVSGGGNYTGKPRPAVILQDDDFDATDSITICPFTTNDTKAPMIRIVVEPDERNGLASPSRIMVDKVTTVAKHRLGRKIGELDSDDIARLETAVGRFLGLSKAKGART